MALKEIMFMLIGILLLQSIFSFFRIYLFALVAEPAMADIRQSLYRKFMTLPMAFYDKKRTGELVSRITSDVSLLQDTFTVSLSELFRQVLVLVVGIGLLFWKTSELTIFMLLTFPVLIIIIVIFGKYIRTLSKKTQDALAKTNIVVEETLQALPMVKAFTNEFFEANRYKTQMRRNGKIGNQHGKIPWAFCFHADFWLVLGNCFGDLVRNNFGKRRHNYGRNSTFFRALYHVHWRFCGRFGRYLRKHSAGNWRI